MTGLPRRRIGFSEDRPPDPRLEWLVTNGLGGYASGPVAGGLSRRFHGVLVAALPAPLGRVMCLNHLGLEIVAGGASIPIDREDQAGRRLPGDAQLEEFALEGGLPVWRYRAGDAAIERRLVMPYGANTTCVVVRLLAGAESVVVRLRPALQVRPHEASLDVPADAIARFDVGDATVELQAEGCPAPVRWRITGAHTEMHLDRPGLQEVEYAVEAARGYDHRGALWSPGWIDVTATRDHPATFVVSTESWEAIDSRTVDDLFAAERSRRQRIVDAAEPAGDTVVAELALAADQFIVTPVGHADRALRARAAGDDPRSVIAGYHWFTDWGRDTMIGLEGLTLSTGRAREARCILRTFAHEVRDGLIPNLFPEGERCGLYHTADATLWFFHALHRYSVRTGDRSLVDTLVDVLVDIADRHVAGTRFGIHVDADGLLAQGEPGYQLTWMDAKVGDWVVTPRRGKAVEINALWYNAMRLLADWLDVRGRAAEAALWRERAAHTRASFNARFWNPSAHYLFDVVDGEHGDDPACRPNQLFAIALDHPVLDAERWAPVVEVAAKQLLTPVGLRSLAPGHHAYQPVYDGDLRARDAAYHQGTVWAWLIGPFVDAWLRVHPGEGPAARRFLRAFTGDGASFGVGSIAEIFDAELPYTPRGCIAQAWSVAEVLRAYRLTA